MSVIANAVPVAPVCLEKLIPNPEAVACLAEPIARRLLCVPVTRYPEQDDSKGELVIATTQPDDQHLYERIIRQLPPSVRVRFVLAEESAIRIALDKCYSHSIQGQDLLIACSLSSNVTLENTLETNTVVRLVEALLLSAFRERASDLHLSSCSVGLRVRFRIDGVLSERMMLRESFYSELVGRIKILATMDIAEARQPQDGQFTQYIDNEMVDFRVSLFPTIHGENIVIRVLRASDSPQGIDSLLLPEQVHRQLLSCLHQPCSLIVFCGPTGSGKSTSMHALLSELDREALNIMTLEDPVEKVSPGIQQTSIDASRALGYAEGLRALMRQDPDVLLIGEVRDASSCQMMLRAVMTGHSLLTTVHARNVIGAIERLIELGANRHLLATHLSCIAAQRLVRKSCGNCLGQQTDCTVCHGTGFHGRQAVVELLTITPKVEALISSAATPQEILAEAALSEFVSLKDQADILLSQGISTKQEIHRVFGA